MTLDEAFYDALRRHPVPLLEAAIRELQAKSLALDLYVWLAYRLHSLRLPTSVSWPSLFAQFGTGFRLARQFKPYFVEAFGAALAAYPEARVSVEGGGNHHASFPATNCEGWLRASGDPPLSLLPRIWPLGSSGTRGRPAQIKQRGPRFWPRSPLSLARRPVRLSGACSRLLS